MRPQGSGAAAAAAPAGTAGVETKSSRRGHRRDSWSSAAGRKRPLTARWPCPQAGPASLAHDIRVWLASLGVGASLPGSLFSASALTTRYWASNHAAVGPLRGTPPNTQLVPAISPAQSCEAGEDQRQVLRRRRHRDQRRQKGSRATNPLGCGQDDLVPVSSLGIPCTNRGRSPAWMWVWAAQPGLVPLA